MLNVLFIRDMLAELAEGEIETEPSFKRTASSMCEDFDFIFGTAHSYYNGLEEDIYRKMSLLRKKNIARMQPINNLINTLKSWDK
jgi:hypothetical protein